MVHEAWRHVEQKVHKTCEGSGEDLSSGPKNNTNERDVTRKTEKQRKRKRDVHYIHIKGIPSILW